MTRTKKSILNLITDLIPWFVIGILGFVKNSIYLSNVGNEIVGLMTTFSSVLVYLALVEGGLGASIDYYLYKPLSLNDNDEIKKVFGSARLILRLIGIAILALSVIALLFIPFIFKYSDVTNLYARTLFILIAINLSIPFLTYQPFLSLITADQKRFKVNFLLMGVKILTLSLSLLFVSYGYDVIYALVCEICINLLFSKFIINKIKNLYPYIKNTSLKLDRKMLVMTKDAFFHRVAVTITFNTDTILLASIIGSKSVPFYNNYNFIIGFIIQIINKVYGAITHSLGNLFSKESLEKKISILKEINAITFIISISITSIFIVTVSDFITIWVGNEYSLGKLTSFLFGFYLFSTIYRKPLVLLIDSNGKFQETRNIRLLESFSNLIISLVLIKNYGINGILFATVFTHMILITPLLARKLYRVIFNENATKYLITYCICLLCLILDVMLLDKLISTLSISLNTNLLIWFIYAGVLFTLNSIIIIFVSYIFNNDFKLFVRTRIFRKLFKKITFYKNN